MLNYFESIIISFINELIISFSSQNEKNVRSKFISHANREGRCKLRNPN